MKVKTEISNRRLVIVINSAVINILQAHRVVIVIPIFNEMRKVASGTERELLEINDYYRSVANNQQVHIPA